MDIPHSCPRQPRVSRLLARARRRYLRGAERCPLAGCCFLRERREVGVKTAQTCRSKKAKEKWSWTVETYCVCCCRGRGSR